MARNKLDAVYMVKSLNQNEELRYSLRSLENLPFINNVVLAGYQPSWTKNVLVILREQRFHSKYINTANNILKACNDPRISEDFILMNDDFFIMNPIEEIPVYHRGPIERIATYYGNLGGIEYAKSMRETETILKYLNVTNPVSYELHTPMVINKTKYKEVMAKIKEMGMAHKRLNKRTLYGNLANIGGKETTDVKIITDSKPNEEKIFLSTDDKSFLNYKVGEYIRNKFQSPSKYERS